MCEMLSEFAQHVLVLSCDVCVTVKLYLHKRTALGYGVIKFHITRFHRLNSIIIKSTISLNRMTFATKIITNVIGVENYS